MLARSKEELERLVAERTAKLQELVGELEHFSYTITHDMRAPLRAMQGFAEMMAETCGGVRASRRQRVSWSGSRLRRSRMDSLITDALNYSRSVRQELPLEAGGCGGAVAGDAGFVSGVAAGEGADSRLKGELPVVMGE